MHRLLTFLAAAFLPSLALAESPNVDYLPMPEGGEWDTIAVAPDGGRVYVGEAVDQIVVIDTATDQVADTFVLPAPEAEWIGGMGMTSDGRLVVSTDIAIYELDPGDGHVLQQCAVPYYSWWAGPMVFTADGARGYLASVDEVFVLDLDPLGIVDTVAGGELDGLLAANPEWATDRVQAYRIALSPDDDRLYLSGEGWTEAGNFPIRTIDGLVGSADFRGLEYRLHEVAGEGSTPRMALSPDGSTLYDTLGNVWSTAEMSIAGHVRFSVWFEWEPYIVAVSPDGELVYFEGWGHAADGGTYEGESIVLVGSANHELLDLDGDPSNGITGIDMPEATGWDGTGGYNGHEWVMTPAGDKLYVAGGSAGSFVVRTEVEIEQAARVLPSSGGNDGEVTVRVFGSWSEGTAVALEREGGPAIQGTGTVVLPAHYGGGLETRFDLGGQPLGAYDVVVSPPAPEAPRRLAGAFTVAEAREAATLELLGDDHILYDGESTVRMVVENIGNVDLRDLVLTFTLTEGTPYRVILTPARRDALAQVDEEQTIAAGPEPIWIDRLPAGRAYEVDVLVAGPEGVTPNLWEIQGTATVGYLTAEPTSSGEADGGRSALIGELCSIGDALATAIGNEARRQGTEADSGAVRESVDRVVRDAAVEYGASKVKDLLALGITALVVAVVLPAALPLVPAVVGALNDMKSCFDFITNLFGLAALFSWDPNDKLSGVGIDGYFLGDETLRYVIRFENLAEATAPATLVTITDLLDESLDIDTFELVGTSHPDVLAVALDRESRELRFVFEGIGLPPNVTPPEGQGWVEYRIRPAAGLESGTLIANQAEIVFDENEPIVTPEVTHEVDRDPPETSVDELPETTSELQIPLRWQGVDDGVGVWDWTVSVSVDDEPFAPWLAYTTETSASYPAEAGHEYRFSVVGRDRLGNAEPASPAEAVAIRVEQGAGAGDGDSGCECRTAGGRPGPAWIILLLAGVALVSRRARR